MTILAKAIRLWLASHPEIEQKRLAAEWDVSEPVVTRILQGQQPSAKAAVNIMAWLLENDE